MTRAATARVGVDPLVGVHVSSAGGLVRAVERGVGLDCRTIQVFTKNSNQWAGKAVVPADAAAFSKAARNARLAPLSAHAAYLINLAAPDEAIRKRSVLGLVDEIERCDQHGIAFLVLHPGSHGGDGEETGLDRIARGLDEAASLTPASKTFVLLESAAGQGACLGHTLAQLAALRQRAASKKRIAFCLDTCHLHAAGYDLVTKNGWKSLIDETEETIGLARVKLIHANDSKKERGCRVDRHERIGMGAIGEAGFANLMTEPAFERVPKILETPKDEAGEYDRLGLAALRRLSNGR
ncbi:MAG: deoxyribonuclease IV [Thermoanaerobaculia bacterium]